MENKLITFENFKAYTGQEVNVEICGGPAGVLYPERNILRGMNAGVAYFESIEEDGDNQFWHWHYADDKDFSMQIFTLCKKD